MKHFSNENKIFSFTGLTPSEHSSGEHKRQGHISRQGRSILRKTLIQAAWRAIHIDPSLEIAFERMARNAGKKRAITGIARRLVGQMRSCFRSNELYRFREAEVIEFSPKTGEISLAASI
jgi:transposase